MNKPGIMIASDTPARAVHPLDADRHSATHHAAAQRCGQPGFRGDGKAARAWPLRHHRGQRVQLLLPPRDHPWPAFAGGYDGPLSANQRSVAAPVRNADLRTRPSGARPRTVTSSARKPWHGWRDMCWRRARRRRWPVASLDSAPQQCRQRLGNSHAPYRPLADQGRGRPRRAPRSPRCIVSRP